ncbi:MAG TPA: L,D-transpeptidase family protein [Syntrophales bacterium]|nr:L,D-transpeptidase family protein [Syntrophales bacterium]
MKNFSINRYSSAPAYLKIGIAAIVLLLLSNFLLLYLFAKERNNNKNLIGFVDRTSKDFSQIHESLRQKDLQKAFRYLTEAQKQAVALLPAAPAATGEKTPIPEVATKEQKPAQAVPAKVTTTAVATAPTSPQDTPSPFVFADAGEYLLICEKETKVLYVFRFSDGRFSVVKQYPCIIGANNHGKTREGDFATPEGVYFFLRFSPGKSLAEKYGYGAFVLNYPNFLDRKERKDGGGIWIHGHSPSKAFGVDVVDTQGCIAVSNDTLREMTGYLRSNGTPVAIVSKLQYANLETQKESAKEIRNFINSWRLAWESINTKKYLSFYSSSFVNAEGMSFAAFKNHKERTNRYKKFIRVKVENLAILTPPEYGGNVAVARFQQRYQSNNFKSDSKKIFYLKKGQAGWQIIGESSY